MSAPRQKSINDRFGHAFGDKVLVEIAGVLRAFSGKDGSRKSRRQSWSRLPPKADPHDGWIARFVA